MSEQSYLGRVRFEHLPKVRTFGGWYQHTVVCVNGREIGRIQTRRRNKRTDTLTTPAHGGCVLGTDVGWLTRMDADAMGDLQCVS